MPDSANVAVVRRLQPSSTIRLIGNVCLTLLVTATVARADVTRFEITSRAPVGTSGYEKIVGIGHFTLDPRIAVNAVIADIDRAPVNAAGKVEFSSDVFILRPLDGTRSNGVALVDVVNRGRKMVLTRFNRGGASDPTTDADLGDGFLMKRGFTIVWVGWEFDIRRAAGQPGEAERGAGMAVSIPSARGVSGRGAGRLHPERRGSADSGRPGRLPTLGRCGHGHHAHRPRRRVRHADADRARPLHHPRQPGSRLAGGFEKGRTYELTYRPTQWPVSGLGLAAYRDLARG